MYNDSFRNRYGLAPVAISSTADFSPTHPHIHSEIEMLYIAKGRSEIRISNRRYEAVAGDLFFINPLEVHAVTVDPGQPYLHQCICFDRALIADQALSGALFSGAKTIPHRFSAEDPGTAGLATLFEALYRAVERSNEALLLDATAAVSSLFSRLITGRLLIENDTCNKATAFSREAIAYLAAHYAEPLTSGTIAEALFYNQSYFCRAFKKNFGVSFSVYLNMYRIARAEERLRHPAKKISLIAAECGFPNSAYFTRCFKKFNGNTPLNYRKSQCSAKI